MTTATSQGEAHEVAKENKKAIQARNLRTGVLFTAPALIVLAIFVFYPAIQTFITSLTNGRINSNARRPAKFIGFQNYITLFQSQDFWTDVKNTLVYAVLYASRSRSHCCSTARTSSSSASSAPACSCRSSSR